VEAGDEAGILKQRRKRTMGKVACINGCQGLKIQRRQMMKKVSFLIGVLLLYALPIGLVHAQDLIVYPAKGQSAQQMDKDKGECTTWAKQQTGVDPVVLAQKSAAQPPAAAPKGERLKGAAKGAAAGAVVGEIAHDDAGKGAATGAAVGVVAGGAKQRQKAQAQQQTQQQQQAQTQQSLDKYNKAYSACLEGKGYTVK
jgi:hypothetical protein